MTRPCTYRVAGRTPGSGPVIAVFADGPTDLAVAAHAADLTARTRTLLVAAAAVHTTGLSVNTILPHARTRRIRADRTAVLGRVSPILHNAGVAYLTTTLLVPTGADPLRALPLRAVHDLVSRFGAVAVVTGVALHDPTGVLQPVPHLHQRVPATVSAPVAAAWTGASAINDSLPSHVEWNRRNP